MELLGAQSPPYTRAPDTATRDGIAKRTSIAKPLVGDKDTAVPVHIRPNRRDRSVEIWDDMGPDNSDGDHAWMSAKLNVF